MHTEKEYARKGKCMKKFMTIWIGELISCIGSGMTAFALSIYVYELTKSVTYVSIVTLLAYMPSILLSPLGGVLADRYDRRLMMILGDLLSGSGLVYMLLMLQLGSNSMAPILIGVTINSVFVALLEPSYKATVTDLLTEEEYAKASGLVQLAGNAKYLISPALAGLILSVADIRVILCLDIMTFFITVIAVAIVRKTIKKPIEHKKFKGFIQEMKVGFDFLKGDKGILALVFIMTLICFFLGFVQTLVVPMILAISNAKNVGIVESISAMGMVVGSIVIGVKGIKKNHLSILMLTTIICGIFMALMGVKNNIYFIGVMTFMFFIMLPFMNTCADVLIRVSIPNKLQGRVWGMISLITQFGTVIAYASCGVLADRIFEPMLAENGILAGSVGRMIGVGEGRGIGLLLIISGIGMIAAALIIGNSKNVRTIQVKNTRIENGE